MTEDLFLDWAIKLLEQIETSEEKKLGAAVIPCIPVVLGRKHSLAIYMIL